MIYLVMEELKRHNKDLRQIPAEEVETILCRYGHVERDSKEYNLLLDEVNFYISIAGITWSDNE